MEYAHGYEQLRRAMLYVATSTELLSTRLASASVDHLSHINPDLDLPEKMRTDFRMLIDRLNDAWGPGPRTMSDDEIAWALREIVELYGRICAEIGPF